MTERRTTDDDEAPRRRPESARTYTVQAHDTLPSIAERLGHPGEWQAIRDANAETIADYNALHIGSELTLPEGWIW